MAVKVATTDLLLDTLVENPNIRAALIVDERGYIIDKRGHAPSLRNVDPGDSTISVDGRRPLDSLYMVEAGADILIVVFDEKLNFERLKKSVDDTLGEFGMAPSQG